MKCVKIMIIGIGPHAKTTYIPFLSQLKSQINFKFSVAVDTTEKYDDVVKWFAQQSLKPEKIISVDFFVHQMPSYTEKYLDDIVEEDSIDCVIIATPPYTHKSYALWALKHKLHILMDKPVTTYLNVCNDEEKAKAIYNDYLEILDCYNKVQNEKRTVFMINVKRRFHSGFLKAKHQIQEISKRFNIPVTSMIVYHSDGQWRLPHELVTLNYHPFNVGYGVISHSGYHIIDIAYWLYESSLSDDKFPDKAEVFSSFLLPSGFLNHISREEYIKIFGSEYIQVSQWPEQFLKNIFQSFGEIDAFITIRFLKEKDIIAHLTLNIQHNSFSRRSWLIPKKDLLKGNGRVRHEMFNISQGPIQNLQLHSYHAYDKHLPEGSHFTTGGTKHFDIYRFCNVGITGGDKPFMYIDAKQISEEEKIDITLSQHAKLRVIKEFLSAVSIENQLNNIESNIESHRIPVKIMSAIYLSHIKQKLGEYPVVTFKI